MNIDFTPLFQAVIAVVALLITRKLIPWIESKTTEKQRTNIFAVVKIIVYAAEQLYGAGEGDKKLDYVLGKLHEYGYDIDKDLVREAIEAAVYEMQAMPVIEEAIEIDGNTLPPVEEWPYEMLVDFCEQNDIPHDGCVTKEDYIDAIVRGTVTAPPTDGGAD